MVIRYWLYFREKFKKKHINFIAPCKRKFSKFDPSP